MRMRYTLTGDRIPWKLSPAPEITMSIFTIRAAENDPEEDVVEEEPEEDEDDDEVEDPQEILNEEVSSSCSKYKAEMDACAERVSAKSNTTETCEQELYDFLHCRDCKVAQTLFSKLK